MQVDYRKVMDLRRWKGLLMTTDEMKTDYYACPDLLGKVLGYVVTQEGPGKRGRGMGHGSDSQNSQASSQPPVTIVPRDLAPSSGF